MRILFVIPVPPRSESPGAIPRVLQATLMGLRERHDVTVVTAAGDEAGEMEAAESMSRLGVASHVVDRRRPEGPRRWLRRLRLASTWAQGRSPWRTVWLADPRIQKVVERLAADSRFDVLVVEDNAMGVFRFPPHIPSVLTEHEVRRPRPVHYSWKSQRNVATWALREEDWRRWRSYQPRVWRRFDLIQVFSDRDAARIRELAPDLANRVRVNPFGIELAEKTDVREEEPGVVLFSGNFTHVPNVDAAVWLATEIMPILRTLEPTVRLRLVGPAAPEAVRVLACPDIEIVGEVASMGPELATAAVVVAPVRIGGGMRVKVLHSLAAQKAVVTTSRGAEGLAAPPHDLPLVIADDAAEIAERIAELLRDTALRHRLGERARAFVLEQHSPAAYARRSEAVYEEAIAVHRASGHRP
jgi:glycosyltransferase involved in cell wall biosynthesis